VNHLPYLRGAVSRSVNVNGTDFSMRTSRIMLIMGLLALMTGSCEESAPPRAVSDPTERPPRPDFYHPVDYVGWLNKQGAECNSGTSADYSLVWGTTGSDKGMPQPTPQVQKELQELAKGPTWQQSDHPEVASYISLARPFLNIFVAESGKSCYHFQLAPDPSDPYNPIRVLLPRLGTSKHAANALMALAWEEPAGQSMSILEAWRTCLQHAEQLEGTGILLFARRGTEIRSQVYRAMRAAAAAKAIGVQDYQHALRLLVECGPGKVDLSAVILSEWGCVLGLIQALYPRERLNLQLAKELGWIGTDGSLVDVNTGQLRASRIKPVELIAGSDEYFVQLYALLMKPLTLSVLHRVDALAKSKSDPLRKRHPLTPILQPNLRRTVRQQIRALTEYRATCLVFLILQHKAKHGAWPDSLSSSGADPILQIDPCSGEEFRYRLAVREESVDNTVCHLYSVGDDGVDDGGTRNCFERGFLGPDAEECDFVYWPPPKRRVPAATGKNP
jgi:hypothetical protein